MALFLSTYTNKVDKKGRVSVPASFRDAIAADKQAFQGIILYRSYKHAALEGCTRDHIQQLAGQVDNLAMFSDAQDDLAATIFADARELAFDSEGRISLPEDLSKHAGLEEMVSFVGRGRTFQVWNPAAFTLHQQEARERAKARGTTLPQGSTA